MRATQQLHDAGQSLWLDNITRGLLTSGTLRRYIEEFSVTGLTSNPTIFDHAIKNSHDYDDAIRQKLKEGKSGEALFFDLALEDLTQAADLFRPIHDQTNGVDGWVSLEVSPLLAHDTAGTVAAAKELHARAGRPNLFIKIPGTQEGLPAIEEAIFAGVPVNVTLLFSREQYVAAAEAYLRGIERRIAAGPESRRRLGGFAVRQPLGRRGEGQGARGAARPARHRHRQADVQGVPRLARFAALATRSSTPAPARSASCGPAPGPRTPRPPTSSTSRRSPRRSRSNTIPETTLKAFADHGESRPAVPADGGDCEEVLAEFAAAGIDIDALAAQLQDEGAKSFVKSWNELMACIASKGEALKNAG